MSFRTRLFLFVSLTVVVSIGLVVYTASRSVTGYFERLDEQRTEALVAQLREEFARRGREVVRSAEGVARAESTQRIAFEAVRERPNFAPYFRDAAELAAEHGLDFVEMVARDGTIISSAQWPARFGYREEWLTAPVEWDRQGAFLRKEELADGTALALSAVRTVEVGDQKMFVVAGLRLGPDFINTIVAPEGVRVLLFPKLDPAAPVSLPVELSQIEPLIAEVAAEAQEITRVVSWPDGQERVQLLPLTGRDDGLLGVLFIGSSRRELNELLRRLRWEGAGLAGAGVLIGLLLSFGIARRVTRPVEELAAGARRVADGDWDTQVDARSGDEIGQLAQAFNTMTRQLTEQRGRLVQTERVAAWRELARRLAHELKNPLFPLQITVENLQRVRHRAPEQFDEVFEESTRTLLDELENLKTIIGRFSDFAKMPAPSKEAVQVNEIVTGALRLFDAQFREEGGPRIEASAELDPSLPSIHADPDQLNRLVRNLILNAADAMPEGGALTIRTRRHDGGVRLEVSDTGQGLSQEERDRLFTPYYTSRRHGTGLGLAVVQSVVSDHQGRISVESEPGEGTTFRIELPR